MNVYDLDHVHFFRLREHASHCAVDLIRHLASACPSIWRHGAESKSCV